MRIVGSKGGKVGPGPGVGPPPIAVDDVASIDENTGDHLINVLVNDFYDGVPTIEIVSQSAGLGTSSISGSGEGSRVRIQSTAGAGEKTVRYSLIATKSDGPAEADLVVTINPVATPPTANDDTIDLEVDSGDQLINVLENDAFFDEPTITITGQLGGVGTATISGSGVGSRVSMPTAGETPGVKVTVGYELTALGNQGSDQANLVITMIAATVDPVLPPTDSELEIGFTMADATIPNPNGTADNTGAIDALLSTGNRGIWMRPGGKYSISAEVNIPTGASDIRIHGNGSIFQRLALQDSRMVRTRPRIDRWFIKEWHTDGRGVVQTVGPSSRRPEEASNWQFFEPVDVTFLRCWNRDTPSGFENDCVTIKAERDSGAGKPIFAREPKRFDLIDCNMWDATRICFTLIQAVDAKWIGGWAHSLNQMAPASPIDWEPDDHPEIAEQLRGLITVGAQFFNTGGAKSPGGSARGGSRNCISIFYQFSRGGPFELSSGVGATAPLLNRAAACSYCGVNMWGHRASNVHPNATTNWATRAVGIDFNIDGMGGFYSDFIIRDCYNTVSHSIINSDHMIRARGTSTLIVVGGSGPSNQTVSLADMLLDSRGSPAPKSAQAVYMSDNGRHLHGLHIVGDVGGYATAVQINNEGTRQPPAYGLVDGCLLKTGADATTLLLVGGVNAGVNLQIQGD